MKPMLVNLSVCLLLIQSLFGQTRNNKFTELTINYSNEYENDLSNSNLKNTLLNPFKSKLKILVKNSIEINYKKFEKYYEFDIKKQSIKLIKHDTDFFIPIGYLDSNLLLISKDFNKLSDSIIGDQSTYLNVFSRSKINSSRNIDDGYRWKFNNFNDMCIRTSQSNIYDSDDIIEILDIVNDKISFLKENDLGVKYYSRCFWVSKENFMFVTFLADEHDFYSKGYIYYIKSSDKFPLNSFKLHDIYDYNNGKIIASEFDNPNIIIADIILNKDHYELKNILKFRYTEIFNEAYLLDSNLLLLNYSYEGKIKLFRIDTN